MKERIKNYWKRNGFTTVFMSALVIVLCMSGISGYRSGKKEKETAQNAAEFAQVEQEAVPSISNEENKETEAAEIANAEVSETFGEGETLVKPTEGDVLMPFSMDTTIYYETLDQYKCNPAMLIKADVNQEVVAAYGGKVTSIMEDHVNGTLLIVDMGNGYKAVYGQMKDISVKEGDSIVKGQALGNVAEPTHYFSKEGSHLYFGLTKDDVPVNPQNFMEK